MSVTPMQPMMPSTEVAAAAAAGADSNTNNEDKPAELTNFPFLDLLPELQLKVLEYLVVSLYPLATRELLPIDRGSYRSYPFISRGNYNSCQPEVTKVSRKIRKDVLALYYSKNIFWIHGNVTEYSCWVPHNRFPTDESKVHLRNMRTIVCTLKITDYCPTPEVQNPTSVYTIDIVLKTSQQKNKLIVEMENRYKQYDTAERREFILNAIKKLVGEPKDGVYDGHYLLKAASCAFDGTKCYDHKAAWRKLEESSDEDDEGEDEDEEEQNPLAPGQLLSDMLSNVMNSVMQTLPALVPANPPAQSAQPPLTSQNTLSPQAIPLVQAVQATSPAQPTTTHGAGHGIILNPMANAVPPPSNYQPPNFAPAHSHGGTTYYSYGPVSWTETDALGQSSYTSVSATFTGPHAPAPHVTTPAPPTNGYGAATATGAPSTTALAADNAGGPLPPAG